MTRRRLDLELVRRGLCDSREQAREAIVAGSVLVGGALAAKPARLVSPGEPVRLLAPASPYVGRGGDKLAAALDAFAVDPAGWAVVDAGASTGGFTDCLLQRGATRVVAVDVGHGQLDDRLRRDDRVDVRERCNVRHLRPDDVGGPVPLVVADLSFISLRTVMEPLVGLLASPGCLIVLVKPQFEVGRAAAGRGRGVIRDPELWLASLEGVVTAGAAAGVGVTGVIVSPITGAKGNVEFLARLDVGAPRGVDGAALRTICDAAAAEE